MTSYAGSDPYVHALLTQGRTAKTSPAQDHDDNSILPCPYCDHGGRIFQEIDGLLAHIEVDHASQLPTGMAGEAARDHVRKAVLCRSPIATPGSTSTPDLTNLTLDAPKDCQPSACKKRPADSDVQGPRSKLPGHPAKPNAKHIPRASQTATAYRPRDHRASGTGRPSKGTSSPYASTPEPSSGWSVDVNRGHLPSASSITFQPSQPHPQPKRGSGQPASTLPRPTVSSNSQRSSDAQEPQKYDPRFPALLLQPDSRPISQEQLASEVKSIYAGLTLVESKCIQVDRAQVAAFKEDGGLYTKLASDHWQARISLHRTLLHEHHDFFLASQHPSASPALRRLASKYSMPARMWKHGIHSFLELLRRRLPATMDYMLAFIYLAYQMMALLQETVPAFEDTWIECLGDLGRYRMAIEDEDISNREIWAGVSRSWYNRAADKNPTVGRLYHHLAILARPNALQQLYYYARSLVCPVPYPSVRESILTLLDPVPDRPDAVYRELPNTDARFIRVHAILSKGLPGFDEARTAFEGPLDAHIDRFAEKWREPGVHIAVTNIAAWFDYGFDAAVLRQLFLYYDIETKSLKRPSTPDLSDDPSPAQSDQPAQAITEADIVAKVHALPSHPTFPRVLDFTMSTLSLTLRRTKDKNVLLHIHVLLSFFCSLTSIHYVAHLVDNAPWLDIVTYLNTILKTETFTPGDVFPVESADDLPLLEDYLIRGQLWSQWYFPQNWFSRDHDEEDRYLERASTLKSRTQRVLRLGYHLSTATPWLAYDPETKIFSTN